MGRRFASPFSPRLPAASPDEQGPAAFAPARGGQHQPHHPNLRAPPCLYFLTPDRRVSRLPADPLPAPLHLARSFLTAHYLRPAEKLRIAWGLARLRRTPDHDDPPFLDWLTRHRQTPRTVGRF